MNIPTRFHIIDIGFDYDKENKKHIPTIKIGFPDNDWKARDAFADYLKAAPAQTQGKVLTDDATREEAPPNNLPNWSECLLRVENSAFIAKRIAEGGHKAEPDSKLADELHRFIYEYDDADPYRSAWFLHRLEKLLDETRARAIITASTSKGGNEMSNPVEVLAASLYAAIHNNLSSIAVPEYDFSVRPKVLTGNVKHHRPTTYDCEVTMFSQMWGSTALGFGGVGGQAMTSAYTVIVESGGEYCVYFGGRFAYLVTKPNEQFRKDIAEQRLCEVSKAHSRYARGKNNG